jgi:hypothetical protein
MKETMNKIDNSLDETLINLVSKREKARSDWFSDISNNEKFQVLHEVQMEYKTAVQQWLTNMQR